MSNIIDNVKVGNHIKTLLKKHQMTQTDLSEKLSISKSAVSQNLSGRSTFDVENLLKIAKIFNITLEELVQGEKQNNKFISDYEKIVEGGIKGLEKTPVQNLRIADPDFYGKVLVDYIIDKGDWEMLIFLHKNDATFTYDYNRRAKEIYLRVIISLLEHDEKEVIGYFIKYREVNGSIEIENEDQKFLVWQLLNKSSNQPLVKKLMTYQISTHKKLFNLIDLNQRIKLVENKDLITCACRYKLSNVFESFMETIYSNEEFLMILEIIVNYKYYESIKLMIKYYKNRNLSWYQKSTMGVQKGIILLLKNQQYDLVIDFIDNQLYIDLTEILKMSIENNHNQIASYIIMNFNKDIVFKKIAEHCLDYDNINLLDKISNYLTIEDLDYLLSYAKPNEINFLIYLVKKGAKFDSKYYNLDTYVKINEILKYFIKKEENNGIS